MPIRLVILWHMHQPFYKDLVTGEYRLPWVRLHALKDYYGMVKLLDEFPTVHQTFNLVPSLLTQIGDYCAGAARDPFLDVAAKPAADLTSDERRFALQYLFQANAANMIARYPRFAELWERFRGVNFDPQRAEPGFSEHDFTDLQVLSQIAWFDEFLLDEPEVAALIRKGHGFSRDDQQFVVHRQRDLMDRVLPAYRSAADRGLIEISTSPFYHPILPLLCDTDAGAAAAPGLPLPSKAFRHPEDARQQLLRGLDLHQQLFGRRPRGVWPSEGSVSEDVVAIAQQLGVHWMATDEGVLARSLGVNFQRDGGQRLTPDSAAQLYTIYRYQRSGAAATSPIHLLFRDHALSDLLGFVYSGMGAAAAAQDLMRRIRESAQPLLAQGRDAVVPIILDGENAWEYYPRSGREFLRRFYDAVARDPQIEAVTVSEAIARQRDFPPLHRLAPGSWINANFNVWIGAPEDNRAWELLAAAREFFSANAERVPEPRRRLAYEELLIAEGSDWNWWYGPEHHSPNDREFDELYRKHLSNVYHLLNAAPPEALAQPIGSFESRPHFVPQTAYVHPQLDAAPRYFDWVGAAMYTADRRASAMHGKRFLLDSLRAGIDESSLYVLVDFAGGVANLEFQAGVEVVLSCDTVLPGGTVPARTTRIAATLAQGAIASWTAEAIAKNGDQRMWSSAAATTSQTTPLSEAPRFRLRSAFEMQVPFTLLGAARGGKLRVRVSVWHGGMPVDALPLSDAIELDVVSESDLAAKAY